MIYLAHFINAGIAMFVITWICFIIVMKVKDYPKPYVYLFAPIGIAGWILDVVFNIIYATIMFRQLPDIHKGMRVHDVTLSHRLRQILRDDTSINPDMLRYKLASGLCCYFIEPHDSDHCGRNK